MPVPVALLLKPLLGHLASQGLGLIANAIQAKGKDVVEKQLGVKIPDDPAQIDSAKSAELMGLQFKHEEFLVTASQEEYRMELADRASARERDAEFIKAGKNNVRGDWLAYSAIGALIFDVLILSFVEVPRGNRDLLLVVLGALIAIVKDVYGFEFGSSKSNERNSQELVKSLRNGHSK